MDARDQFGLSGARVEKVSLDESLNAARQVRDKIYKNAIESLLPLLMMMLLWPGCNRSSQALEMNAEVRPPAVLLSEVESAEDRIRFGRCPVSVTNPGSVDQTATLLRTGCSCYGVSLDGQRLANGAEFTVPANQTRELQIEFQPASSQSEKFYTADFGFKTPEGETSVMSVKCRYQVYADVRLTPTVITIDAIPQKSAEAQEEITIEHVFRGGPGDSQEPEFPNLPASLRILQIQKSGSPEKIEPNLWRQFWKATVQIRLPADRSEGMPPLNYHVSVSRKPNGSTVSSRGSVVVHTRQKIAFPNRVNFGKVKVGHSRSRKILLSSLEDQLFRLQCNPDDLPPELQVQFFDYSEKRHLVELILTPSQAGPFSEELILQTDMFDVTQISIRLEGIAE